MAKLYVVDSNNSTITHDNAWYTSISSTADKQLSVIDSNGATQIFPLANTTMSKVDNITLSTKGFRCVRSNSSTYGIATSKSSSTSNNTNNSANTGTFRYTETYSTCNSTFTTTANKSWAVSGKWKGGGIYITVSGGPIYMGCNDVYHTNSTQWNVWYAGVHDNIRNYGIGNFYSTIYGGEYSSYKRTVAAGTKLTKNTHTFSVYSISERNRNESIAYSITGTVKTESGQNVTNKTEYHVTAQVWKGTNVKYASANNIVTTVVGGNDGYRESQAIRMISNISQALTCSATSTVNNIATV